MPLLLPSFDPQSSITREEFEELAGDFWERAAAPLRRIIERNNLKPEELDGVELLGGGTRIPRLQVRPRGGEREGGREREERGREGEGGRREGVRERARAIERETEGGE
jgi:hypothetical protein